MTTNTIYNFKTTTTEPPDSRKPTPPKPGQITACPPNRGRSISRHNLATETHIVEYAGVADGGEWQEITAELPTNPNTGRPILPVPDRLLRPLPTLNAHATRALPRREGQPKHHCVGAGRDQTGACGPRGRLPAVRRLTPASGRGWAWRVLLPVCRCSRVRRPSVRGSGVKGRRAAPLR